MKKVIESLYLLIDWSSAERASKDADHWLYTFYFSYSSIRNKYDNYENIFNHSWQSTVVNNEETGK